MANKNKNEGEGSRSADKQYRDGVKKYLKTHDVDREAKDAAKALDDPREGPELREAEKAGRERAASRDN